MENKQKNLDSILAVIYLVKIGVEQKGGSLVVLTTCQFRKLQDYRGGVGASWLANLARESSQAVTTRSLREPARFYPNQASQAVTTRSLREQARSYPSQASQPPTDQPVLAFVGEVMRN
jgi:hypothetical protein